MTGRVKSLIALVVLAAIATIGVVWRSAGPRAPVASNGWTTTPRGGVLRASIRSEPRSFNRYASRDAASDLVSRLTQAKLVRIDQSTQEWEPWLAERAVAAADGITYTLTLRDDVVFSDGHPFTSADVLFAFEAVYDERSASPLAETLKIGGRRIEATALDPSTVVLRFPSPFGPGLRVLDNLPILPKHRLAAALRDGQLASAWPMTAAPGEIVGLGPFVVTEYQPGQRLVLARNPHYWRRDRTGAALPFLDGIVLEIVPDQNTEILRLLSGELDLMQSEVRAEDYPALKRAAGASRVRLADLGVGLDPDFLWFNLNPEAAKRDPRRAWLRSIELRRAISAGIDRQSFANTVYLGAGVPVYGPVTPSNRLWFSPSLPPVSYDPARARTLLAGTGLVDRDGDGTLEEADGRAARFSLLTQKGHTARERGAAVLQEDLRRLGIGVDVVALDPGALVDRLTRSDYDAIYFGILASDTDPAVNLDFWLSSGPFHAWNPEQPRPATDWERRIDELMARQIATVDREERKRLFDEVQAIFADQVPAIHFVAPRVYIAMSARVANATPVVLRPQVLWDADMLAVTPPARSTH